MIMRNKSAKTATDIFVELKHETRDQWDAKLANGLAHLAQSVEELHAHLDAIDADRHPFKMALVDSVEARLKAVGLIPKK